MKAVTSISIVFAVMASACASSPASFDRNSYTWASTIVGCQSAAEIAGTDTDKAVWAYERQDLMRDRNQGWSSDRARLSNAVAKDKENLAKAGNVASSRQLANCQQVINTYFPDGHPVG